MADVTTGNTNAINNLSAMKNGTPETTPTTAATNAMFPVKLSLKSPKNKGKNTPY